MKTFLLMLFLGLGVIATAQAQDGPAPIIDRTLFFGDPAISGAQVSPDGQFIAFLKPYNEARNIWVKGIDESFEAARPLTADTRPVAGYSWSRGGRILYAQDKGGNENFHVYAVDPAAEGEGEMNVPPARDLTPYDDIQARIFSVPKATPNQVLIGLNDRDPQLHDVYRLDLTTGERTLVLENTEGMVGWQADLDGRIRLGLKLGADGGTELYRVDDGGTLTLVYTCSNEETCGPVTYHKDGQRVYLNTNKGDDVDLGRLVLFNPDTGEEEVVESDPEGEVDFGNALFSDVTDELIATVYEGDRVRVYPKTDDFAELLETLRAKLPEGEISLTSSSADERLFTVAVSRDVDPGSVYLFNRDTGTASLIYRSRPELPSEHLAEVQAIRYTARDGLVIPAYLTLPKGMAATNLPAIILPHGGPWARDTWGYDPFAQFLANRGYAVLQPNFRGSTGYGKAFLNAGNKEWGTGAMQHDLSDGVQYLIDNGIADPARVGIFGGSYGGYATLAGLAFTPELYAAGVSYVGPSNLHTLLASIPPYWEPIRKIFHVRMGNPEVAEEYERLTAQSPLFSADKITAPLFVIQGANDPRVKKAESEQIVMALRDLGRDVAYMLAEDEGHGFRDDDNRLAVSVAMETFLAEHLGGRMQTAVPEALAQKVEELMVDVNTVTAPQAPPDASTLPAPAADGSLIEAGSMSYASKIEVMGQSFDMTTTRTIEPADYKGQPVWRIIDASASAMGAGVDTFEVDRGTLKPVRRYASGQGTMDLVYTDTAITGELASAMGKMPVNVALDAPVLGDGPGLVLALAGMPLAPGYQTIVGTFDALSQKVRTSKLMVKGPATTETEAGTFDTFEVVLEPIDGEAGGGATIFVIRDAPHYVIQATYQLPAAMGNGTVTNTLTKMGE